MSRVIIGMPEAVEAAKKAGLGNMQISAPLVIEMAEYINRLESAERDEQARTIHVSMVRPRLPFIDVHPEHKNYIEQLEKRIALSKGGYLQMAEKLNALSAEYNKLSHAQADKNHEQLDQFAMAALPIAHEQVQELTLANMKEILGLKTDISRITGEQVRQAVAITAYMMAEAMQAESRKRQGGA